MPTIKTDAGFADTLDQLARDSKALAVLEAAEKKEIITVRDKRAERVAELKRALKEGVKHAANYLRKFRDRLIPAGRKSADTALAEFGLRTSTSIVALSADWDEEKTVEALLKHGFDTCVVTVVRMDKEALEKLDDEELARVGLRRRPSETFWYKPKTGADASVSEKSL